MRRLDLASLHNLEDLPPHSTPTSLNDAASLGWAAACCLTTLPTTLQYDPCLFHTFRWAVWNHLACLFAAAHTD